MNAASLGGRFFIDTNIFVCSFDEDDAAKQSIAQMLIGFSLESGRGVISSQVVQEFLSLAVCSFEQPLTPDEARLYLRTTMAPLCKHIPSIDFYDRALGIQQETSYSFRDALIITAALDLRCTTLLSEDLQRGRKVRGMTILNPF